MFGAVVVADYIWGGAGEGAWWVASGTLVLVGALDDRFDLPVKIRFSAQIFAVVSMVLGAGLELKTLGMFGASQPLMLGILAVPFTIFAVVGVVNAMNMIDGMDGLAGGLALVTICAMALLAVLGGQSTAAAHLLVIAAAVVGFLFFNLRTPWRHKAALFMGDAGSMFLGMVIAWYAVYLTQGDTAVMAPVTALWLFAVPLVDTITVMMRRVGKGQSPFRGDRKHLHHVLLRAGVTPGRSVGVIVATSFLFASIGLLGEIYGAPQGVMLIGFSGIFALHYWATRRAWWLSKRLRRWRENSYAKGHA